MTTNNDWQVIATCDTYEDALKACKKRQRNYDFKIRRQANGTYTVRRRLKKIAENRT